MLRSTHPDTSLKLPLQEQPIYINDLELVRNKYALRLQKGIAEHLIKHKHARSIYLYLELKPLFNSGIIFASAGKIPYAKIAQFVGEGVSTVRRKITILIKLKLVTIDKNKNLQLCSLNKLPKLLKLSTDENKYKKKYKLLNNEKSEFTVKQIALFENLARQEHQLFRKIFLKELAEEFFTKKHIGAQEWVKELNAELLDKQNSNRNNPKFYLTCERYFSKKFLKLFRKQIRENFEFLKQKYKRVYDTQILQLSFGFPALNPNITLSYNGLAKIWNYKTKSAAHYQVLKLAERGLIDVTGNYSLIKEQSPAVYESMCGMRADIFSYVYPTRKTLNGKARKYFRNQPNTVKPLVNATFF